MRGLLQYQTTSNSATQRWRILYAPVTAALLAGFSGCGQSPAEPAPQAELTPSLAPTPVDQLPRRSAHLSDGTIELASAQTESPDRPDKGSAEWLLTEIAHLRSAPLDVVRQPVPGQPGQFQEVRLTSEQVEQEQFRRHEKTIELAMQAISKTHQDENASQQFNTAVHYLAGARMQLALAGHEKHGQLLDENAEALFNRDPTSFAAIEAASHVVNMTQTMADRHAQQDPQWAIAFARQSRLFAERFPQETSRAAVNLIAAGRLCERLQLDQEAIACLTVIEQIAPESPYEDQVAGSLRRLRLPGNPLREFGGSTIDGGFTSIDQFRGKNVLISFWASNSEQFRQHLPAIQAAVQKSRGQLVAVGVNMDRDEREVEKFLRETGMNWKNIFYSDPEKRGSRNVVARHYGVINVPEYWLVDASGIVRSIHLDATNLEQSLTDALSR